MSAQPSSHPKSLLSSERPNESRSRLNVFIAGEPRPQGSKRHVGNGVMVEASKYVKDWRADVRQALLNQHGEPKAKFEGEVHLALAFILTRPRTAPKKRKLSAAKKPDLDKLIRAVMDAISSAHVWRDDCQVVKLSCGKRVAGLEETAGLWLSIEEMA